MLIVFRGTICWEELCPKPLRGYLICWISDEVYRRSLVVSNADTGLPGGFYGFRRYGFIPTKNLTSVNTLIGVNSIERSAQEGENSFT